MISVLNPKVGKIGGPVYCFKIALQGTEPPVWRRLLVPGNATLSWFHAVIQVAMGWTNSHLHHFLIGKARYVDPRYDEDMGFGEEPDCDETKTTLAEVVPSKGAHFVYEYDFGDSWQHKIVVEKILSGGGIDVTHAECVDGARACPPEDCGGVWGYANLLKILKDKKHPEHRTMKEWLGRPLDPEFFDREHTNRWLRKLKWPRVTEAQLRKILMGRHSYVE